MKNIAELVKKLSNEEFDQLVNQLKENGFCLNEKYDVIEIVKSENIPEIIKKDSYDLSHAQKRLWILDQLEVDSIAYNMPASYILEGELDDDCFNDAFNYIVERHESLRTIFILENGNPKQKILENQKKGISFLDFSSFPDKEDYIRDFIGKDITTPFNLNKGPLIRLFIIKMEYGKYLLHINMHHIISDVWSLNIIVNDFLLAYNCLRKKIKVSLTPLRIQYKDYSAWQNNLLISTDLNNQKKYWLEKLSGKLPVLDLPSDKIRPKIQSSTGGNISFTLPKHITSGMKELCKRNKVSLFMLLQAIIKILFNKYTGQNDILLGSPLAGRVHKDLENQIGFYINTLVFRDTIIRDETFAEFLESVKATCTEAFANQDYPFDKLVEELNIKKDISRSPIFDVMLTLQNNEKTDIELDGLTVSTFDFKKTVSLFDMSFIFYETEESIFCNIEYNSEIYHEKRLKQLVKHLETLIQSVLINPRARIRELEFIDQKEKNLLLNKNNGTKTENSFNYTLIELFEEMVKSKPNNIAIVFDNYRLTYQELNEKANIVGNYIKGKYSIKPDGFVGVILERSEKMIISLLGILKAGAAYIPIDPGYPEERIKCILSESNVELVISDYTDGIYVDISEILDSDYSRDNPEKNISPDNLAYLLYTSGSTGNPKGVMVSHRNIINLISNQEFCTFEKEDKLLLTGSISFDITTYEIWGTIVNGIPLVITEKDNLLDSKKLGKILEKNKITILHLIPQLFNQLAQQDISIFGRLRYFLIGGDLVRPQYVCKLRKLYPSMRIFHMYGPTENTTFSTFFEVDKDYDKLSIGRPLNNCNVYILDNDNHIQPYGIQGEICVSGASVSKGYHNDLKSTEKKFIKIPEIDNGIIYKTGDLGRWTFDGNIEFLGRKDNQVKLRGIRIELDEIENVLLGYKGINSVTVILKDFDNGDKELHAFYVSEVQKEISLLRSFLGQYLPGYMIPSNFIHMDSLPLTPNGKIDRKFISEIEVQKNLGVEYFPPQSKTEAELVKIWEDVLGVDRIGIHDNFFELGGHSLKATRMISRISRDFEVEITLKDIFSNPVIESLSRLIELSVKKLYKAIKAVPIQESYPVSNAQKRLWVLQQLDGDGIAYNMPRTLILQGEFNQDAFQKAYNFMTERHESLRTLFISEKGEPRQKILDHVNAEIKFFDLRDSENRDERAHDMASIDFLTSFNLEEESLSRLTILRLEDERYLLLFNMHHIISDGWSMDVFSKEFLYAYNNFRANQTPDLEPLIIQYKDYSAWQKALLESPEINRQRIYWHNRLSGEIPVLDLPSDNTRPALQTFNGDSICYTLSKEIVSSLNSLCSKIQVSMFMLLQALVKVLLHRYSGQTDIIIGSPIAGRNHVDLENQIGFYVNTLVFRDSVKGEITFIDLLNNISSSCTEAFDNQDYPFDLLVEELDIKRDLSRSPLFDVMLVLQNNETGDQVFDGLTVSNYMTDNFVSKFDITYRFSDSDDGMVCGIEYNTDIYSKIRIERMITHFEKLIDSVLTNPDSQIVDLEIVSKDEKNHLLNTFNNTRIEYPNEKTIVQLFEEQVERTPDNIAVVFEDVELSYKELNEKANIVGHYLRDKYDIQPDDLVGVLMDRSEKIIIALLGILKSGAAYVPIDIEYPVNRIEYIHYDSEAKVVLTENNSNYVDINEILSIGNNISNPSIQIDTNSAFYVIYTSGTTGNPKGSIINNRNYYNYITWAMDYYFDDRDIGNFGLFTSISFDLTTTSLFLTLLRGKSLEVFTPKMDIGTVLVRIFNSDIIDSIKITPSHISILKKLGILGSKISLAIVGGEELLNDQVEILKDINKDIRIINEYGPTETTVGCIFKEIRDSKEKILIGKPISNTRIYIMDQGFGLQPLGIPGELCISGSGLARGYLNRPELTADKFVENPFNQGYRMYKTGDLARWQDDGNIEFLGRIDSQVKIRGFRIELGEIENSLLQHNEISSALVVAKDGTIGEKQLLAYLVSEKEQDLSELRDFLNKSLPDYMIPSYFIHMESMPLTPNGKIDMKALPEPASSYSTGAKYVAPGTEIEKKLTDIWQNVLGIDKIGIEDNFFELGGNSIRAITMIGVIGEKLKKKVSLKTLFKNPTIKTFSVSFNDSKHDILRLPQLSHNKDSRFESFPLTDVQQAYWIGRKDNFDLGGVGTHAYSEMYFNNIDIDRLNYSLNYLIQRHDILRMVVTEDGQQRIIENVGEYNLEILDLRGLSEKEEISKFYQLREKLSHQVFSGEKWPLFDIRVTIFRDGTFKLHYSMDALLMDASSTRIFFNEIISIYADNWENISDLDITFRDYVITEQIIKETELYKKSYEYWIDRIPSLPDSIDILLAKSPTEIESPKFKRKSFYLEEKKWKSLERKISSENITPSVFFIVMFGYIINTWSKNSNFLLNLTLFNRIPVHKDVNRILGDFTSLTMLEMDYGVIKSIIEQLNCTQNQLLDDLEHKFFSGVEVQRELTRELGHTVTIPIVVTSTLGESEMVQTEVIEDDYLKNETKTYQEIKKGYSITQTSQVWLDFKLFDHQKGIGIDWDYVDDLFSEGMLDDMFEAFSSLINHYTKDISDWNKPVIDIIPEKQLENRLESNSSSYNFPDKLLCELFIDSVKNNGNKTAIKTSGKELTYKELYNISFSLGCKLESAGVNANELIGVLMNKGWEQIVAVLGIQFSGAAYMPIDASLPISRINKLIELGDVDKVVSVSSVLDGLTLDKGVKTFCVDNLDEIKNREVLYSPKQTVNDLAYVIFTSGSTGEPKGVMIDHRGAVNTILDINHRFNITESDICFALSSLSFDLSVYDVFGLLAAGGTIVIPKPEERKEPASWLNYLIEDNITIWNSVPPLMQMLVDYAEDYTELKLGLRRIFLSGDWIPISLPDRIKAVSINAEVTSLGGATEASIWSIYYQIKTVDPSWKSIPYGKPLLNQSFHVLKKDLSPCPDWVSGDLYIGGSGLAIGYWKDRDKTDSSFIHNETGERLYRTGDLGRYLPNGNIEFLGRMDNQVKIRGFRIELGEIENALLQIDNIESVVVIAKEGATGDKHLIAYFSSSEEQEASDLRILLSKSLPDYMIPSFFIHLDEFPLTPNGKIDRGALPEPDGSISHEVEYVAPENEIEEKLVEIWQEVLGVDKIGINDNFFELGGHSLKATRMVLQVNKKLEVSFSLRDIFENPTIETLSQLIIDVDRSEHNHIKAIPKQESYDISSSQRRLWILDQLGENSIAYNMPSIFILEGEFKEEAFRKAYFYIVERHESLRTVFISENGNPKQRILEDPKFIIEIIDLRNSTNKKIEAEDIVEKDLSSPFNLSTGPLIQFRLIRIEDEKYIIMFNIHHIVSDGWSMNILTRDFLDAYNSFRRNQVPDLKPLRIHYKDYSAWQNNMFENSEVESQKNYWLEKLKGELPVLNLATDYTRPSFQTINGDRYGFTLSKDVQSGLNNLCRSNKVSLFMMLQGLVKVLLHKYSGHEDIIIGSPIAGRVHSDLENQIGFYLNNLVLRDTVRSEDNFSDFLKNTAQTCTEAFENQDYPFDRIVEDLDLKRDLSRSPLFDILVILQNNETTELEFDGLRVLPYISDKKGEASKYDITFDFTEVPDGLYCALRYNTDIYSADSMKRMGKHLETLFSSVLEDPESRIKNLDIIPVDEKNLLLKQFNDTDADYPVDRTIVDLFEEQVEKTPDNIAVIFKDIQLTYRELNEKSNMFANYLLENHAVTQGDFIGVFLRRSEKIIITLLGILKSGAAYVPVEVDYPEERQRYIIEDSDPKVIISETNRNIHVDINEILKGGYNTNNPRVSIKPESLLYVLYTSGTTGKPKGIMTKHENVVNFVNWGQDYFFNNEIEGNFGLFSSISFDFTSTSLFLSLLRGKILTVFDQGDDIDKILYNVFNDSNVDSVKLTPSHISLIQDLGIFDSKMKLVITGGEELLDKHVDILRGTSSDSFKIVNAYGPTESTMTCIVKTIEGGGKISIGKPMANVKIHIMDGNNLTGLGIPGEICVSGAGISKGYLNKEDLTAGKFVNSPFSSGKKMYRTGDLGRWLPDGNIEFLGRIDGQIKIRGFRVEPGEVERILLKNESIESAVVSTYYSDGEKELVSYYVSDKEFFISELITYVSQYLPDYMIPTYFVPLNFIPMTINGKVDKRSLPDPVSNNLSPDTLFEAPETEVERKLVDIWENVLGKEGIGINDKFFELGGNSIKLIKLSYAIKEELGFDIIVVDLFKYTTIKEISGLIPGKNMKEEEIASFSL